MGNSDNNKESNIEKETQKISKENKSKNFSYTSCKSDNYMDIRSNKEKPNITKKITNLVYQKLFRILGAPILLLFDLLQLNCPLKFFYSL